MAKTKTKKKTRKASPRKKASRIWGFLVAHNFTPGGFHTRICKPYFETGNRLLADAVRKAKGTTELDPVRMEQYKAAQRAYNPALMRKHLQEAVVADESERAKKEREAAELSAEANTAAQAAKQRAREAAERVKRLEAEAEAKAKAEADDDGDLFDGQEDEDEEEAGGLTLDDLQAMSEEELSGVLELYSIPIPSPATRAVLLQIAQEAVKGNIREEEEKEEAAHAD